MRSTILLVTLLIFVQQLVTKGRDLDYEDKQDVIDFINLFCKNPPLALQQSVKCLEKQMPGGQSPRWVVKHGRYGAVLFADITPTAETKVYKLYLPFKWERQPYVIQPLKKRVKSKVEVVIKRLFKEAEEAVAAAQKERSNALRLAVWEMGPKVYEISINDPAVQFEEYIVLERIHGWHMRGLFERVRRTIKSLQLPVDKDLGLNLVRKLLYMQIAYMEGVALLWSHGYRHCDAHAENVMIRAAPDKKCEKMKKKSHGKDEGIKFDVIDGYCAIWNKKYVALIDSSFMVKVEDTTKPVCGYKRGTKKYIPSDIFRTTQRWRAIRQLVFHKLPDIDLARKIDNIIGKIPKALPPPEEYQRYTQVLKDLKSLRSDYGGAPATEKWSLKDILSGLRSLFHGFTAPTVVV